MVCDAQQILKIKVKICTTFGGKPDYFYKHWTGPGSTNPVHSKKKKKK